MYMIVVEARFSAVHRVGLPDGTLESPHTHDWGVRACFARDKLDESGMVVDFHEAREGLASVLAQLHQADLNKLESLSGLNPTAEVVAGHVFERLRALGLSAVRRVEVTEAPGCTAIFERSGANDRAG